MIRTYTSVSRYIQGPGALDKIGSVCLEWGKRPLVITDEVLKTILGQRIENSFVDANGTLDLVTFPGEVTRPTIDKLAEYAHSVGADVIAGVGGGKALDTAKAVALAIGSNMISVPTIASTDAPASFAIAVYNDDHLLTEVLKMPRNPDVVLVDTAVICGAPERFLVAGIGDAISKKFEAEACAKAGAEMLMGGPTTRVGQALSNSCYELIREYALPALESIRKGQPDDNVEALVEATVLLSTLSFENGGLSVSHAIAKGIPLVARAKGTLHGEHVAYGLLVQLTLEDRAPEFILEIIDFYKQVGLPYSLSQLGLTGSVTEEELAQIGDIAMTSPSAQRFYKKLDSGLIQAAIISVESSNH